MAVVKVAEEAAYAAGLPEGAIQLIDDTSREAATYMMGLNGIIDVLIPRGAVPGLYSRSSRMRRCLLSKRALATAMSTLTRLPTLEMGAEIIFNAKTSRPSVCNAAETLLVHEAVAARISAADGQEIEQCRAARLRENTCRY